MLHPHVLKTHMTYKMIVFLVSSQHLLLNCPHHLLITWFGHSGPFAWTLLRWTVRAFLQG
jgi:hypothetical protein